MAKLVIGGGLFIRAVGGGRFTTRLSAAKRAGQPARVIVFVTAIQAVIVGVVGKLQRSVIEVLVINGAHGAAVNGQVVMTRGEPRVVSERFAGAVTVGDL